DRRADEPYEGAVVVHGRGDEVVGVHGSRRVGAGGAAEEERVLAVRENEQLGDLITESLRVERGDGQAEPDESPQVVAHGFEETSCAEGRQPRPPLTPQGRALPSKPEMSRPDRTIILDARALSRALQRMAVEVLELAHGTDDLVLIGILRRGVAPAERIGMPIDPCDGGDVPIGVYSVVL